MIKPEGVQCQPRRSSSQARPRFKKKCLGPSYKASEMRSKKQSARKRGQTYCQWKSFLSFQHPCLLAKRRSRRSRRRAWWRITSYKHFGDRLYIQHNRQVSTNFYEAKLHNTYQLIYLFWFLFKKVHLILLCRALLNFVNIRWWPTRTPIIDFAFRPLEPILFYLKLLLVL